MIDKNNIKNFTKNFSILFKNNFKVFIFVILSFILMIIFYQYYLYQKGNKVLELSIIYDQAKDNVHSKDFEEKMSFVAKENGIFGVLATLELINKSLNNNEYNYAYEEYINLLKNHKSKSVYNSIVALHGAYNLIDYVSSESISNILSFVDESSIYFIGYKEEVEYLLSIKNYDIDRREELYNKIINNKNIPEKIKERVKKINEFEKFK